ncbi:hypothetical protein D3C72_1641190 [compost metagenome]
MLGAVEFEGLVQAGQEFLGHGFCLGGGVLQVGGQGFEHDDEFVAAKAGHGVGFAHAAHQAGGDLGQELVAHVVAQGVVEVFEVIEVDEQQGAEVLGALAGGDGALQAVQQQAAVGQAGEGVEEGQALDFLFCALAVCDVHGEAMGHHRAIGLAVRNGIGHVPAHAAVGHAHTVLTLPGHQPAHRRDRRALHLW